MCCLQAGAKVQETAVKLASAIKTGRKLQTLEGMKQEDVARNRVHQQNYEKQLKVRCCAVLCCAVLGWAGLGWAVLFCSGPGWAGLGWAALGCAVLRSAMLCSKHYSMQIMMLCYAIPRCAVLHCTMPSHAVQSLSNCLLLTSNELAGQHLYQIS